MENQQEKKKHQQLVLRKLIVRKASPKYGNWLILSTATITKSRVFIKILTMLLSDLKMEATVNWIAKYLTFEAGIITYYFPFGMVMIFDALQA